MPELTVADMHSPCRSELARESRQEKNIATKAAPTGFTVPALQAALNWDIAFFIVVENEAKAPKPAAY
ncbi:hypothetical protein [Pseudomonas sp. M30-35]|uniref:hypothetical protein n=1 Tax=Pseudomonas sp. M30-35 TaxID=1981174 RepID=UPI000B3C59E7|nr:hypothetical protein [Pseudomonas sp. M30-35]ARU87767.1 hypothetical protein B9K09_07210 [Pseudomonas sp. M30-35]